VRNPTTLDYYSRSNPNGVGFTQQFPNAATYCAANSTLVQNDPGKGCINDVWQQVGQVLPDTKSTNFFGRFGKQINAQTEAYVELGLFHADTRTVRTTITPSGGNFTVDGNVISNTAAAQLGATHPDNPYFGTAARLSYNPVNELGGQVNTSSSNSVRLVAGLKGTWSTWDYDTAFQYSESKQTDVSEKVINKNVAFALLNPTAANVAAAKASSALYAALPPGTFWRIGENAGLNSPAMYQALLQDSSRDGFSKSTAIDFKATREFGKLEGGPIGVAVGAEYRKDKNNLDLYSGLGNYIGIPLTTYGGDRSILAAYGELLFPVTKRIELTAALRVDRYSDVGSSVTPKVGGKWKVLDNMALRGTYGEGFRAPSSTENNSNSFAAFGGATVNDNVRTAAGVPNQQGIAPTFVQRGNPNLEPEKSQSTTLGVVWDLTPKTTLTADLWRIKRKGLPVLEDPQSAVDAGHVTRDPSTITGPGDPGAILAGFVTFVNSAQSLTQGIDLDAKHRFDLGGGNGRLTMGASWSHMFTQRVIDADGTVHDYAGTHGDCNITNCMGSPKDRVTLTASWDMGKWKVSANVNYRGSITNKFEQSDTGCAMHLADGSDAPGGCKVASFYTVDMAANYKFTEKTEIFGSIQNLLDKKPPFDPLTYGAIGYNPLDYSGAVGRFFKIGVRHKF
jgi:iron complex outermembrane recepter protein